MRQIVTCSLALTLAMGGGALADQPVPERSTDDRPEQTANPCMCTHLIYFVPTDGNDRDLDIDGTITRSVRSLRAWFAAQMQRAPKIDRIAGTDQFDITFVYGRGTAVAYQNLSDITTELEDRGFDDPDKRYLVYAELDRGTTCGEATYGLPLLSASGYAVVYLASSGCQASDFGQGTAATAGGTETIAVHEWLHIDGVVAPTAPRHCPTSIHHVCTGGLYLVADVTGIEDPERTDVMYPRLSGKLSQKVLDRNRDDYLDHGIPILPDLRASAWLEAM